MPFRDLVGHRSILTLLARAAARDSLPQSLIFSGPDGVGKRTAAVALAQALNCVTPVAFETRRDEKAATETQRHAGTEATGGADAEGGGIDACGACLVCRRIVRRVHADVLLVEPDENGSIKIDVIRDVIERTGYRPFEGRRRVVIIDEADALEASAQHALLKTLEEPPSASIFVLVTARPDSLLPTVRSRCPRLRFGPLTAREVAAALAGAHGYAEDEALAAAASAEGSVGQALDGATDAAAEARHLAARVLHTVARPGEARRRLEAAAELVEKKTDRDIVSRRVRAIASLLRDLELLTTRANEALLANLDLKSDLERLVPAYDSARTLGAFSAVDRALVALERNASPKIVADWLVLQL